MRGVLYYCISTTTSSLHPLTLVIHTLSANSLIFCSFRGSSLPMCGAMFFSPTSLVAVPKASAAASRTEGSGKESYNGSTKFDLLLDCQSDTVVKSVTLALGYDYRFGEFIIHNERKLMFNQSLQKYYYNRFYNFFKHLHWSTIWIFHTIRCDFSQLGLSIPRIATRTGHILKIRWHLTWMIFKERWTNLHSRLVLTIQPHKPWSIFCQRQRVVYGTGLWLRTENSPLLLTGSYCRTLLACPPLLLRDLSVEKIHRFIRILLL